jgi:hypothetical protein
VVEFIPKLSFATEIDRFSQPKIGSTRFNLVLAITRLAHAYLWDIAKPMASMAYLGAGTVIR